MVPFVDNQWWCLFLQHGDVMQQFITNYKISITKLFHITPKQRTRNSEQCNKQTCAAKSNKLWSNLHIQVESWDFPLFPQTLAVTADILMIYY